MQSRVQQGDRQQPYCHSTLQPLPQHIYTRSRVHYTRNAVEFAPVVIGAEHPGRSSTAASSVDAIMAASGCADLDFNWEFLADEELKLEPTVDLNESLDFSAASPSNCQSFSPAGTASVVGSKRDLESYCCSPAPSTSAGSSFEAFEHCTLDTTTSDIFDEIQSSPWVVSPRPQLPSFSDEDGACGGGLCFSSVCRAECPELADLPSVRTMSESSADPLTPDTPASTAASSPGAFSSQKPSDLRGLPGTVAPGRGSVPKKRGRKPTEGRCCMVPSCNQPLSRNNMYYFRRRMCETCIRQSSVVVDGREMRFCQQCSLAHPIGEFDTNKRSCRAKLQAHKARAHDKKADPSSPTKRRRRSRSASSTIPVPEASVQRGEEPGLPAAQDEGSLPVPQLEKQLTMSDFMDVDLALSAFGGASDHVDDILYASLTDDAPSPFDFKS